MTSDLDPLIVTAPTIRCGTTLLQRLICSSSDALLFGEPAANDLGMALRLIRAQTALYASQRDEFAGSLEAFTSGNRNDWMIDLMPDVDGYTRAIAEGFLQPLAYCRDFARRAGRRVWGVKYPGWTAEVLRLILETMPRAKMIYIHRDIVPVLRSAKARGSLRRAEVKPFCEQWSANMRGAMALPPSERLLMLSYEELIAEPEATLQRLESFAGLAGIDRAVMAKRVNAWSDEEGSSYIAPAELSDAERQAAQAAREQVTSSAGATR